MFTEETIEILICNISKIMETTTQNGFANLRLFQPLITSELHYLHFLVKINNEDVSLFDKARLKLNLEKILKYDDIIILTENELDSDGKARIIGPELIVCPENAVSIKSFFMEKLMPSAPTNQLRL